MRYQSGLGEPGTMDTEGWFAALMAGVDGPLGSVLDVGAAEGVMCLLAAQRGATAVTGVDTNSDRIHVAEGHTLHLSEGQSVTFCNAPSEHETETRDTVILSMIAHWVGRAETQRLARLARKYVLVVFREANEHYQVPENGTWFPTLDEMDATVGGVRTHEEVVLTQDHGKRVWAATYRTDLEIRDGQVWKNGKWESRRWGRDLHGDAPFRPVHGRHLATLTEAEQENVRILLRGIAWNAVYDHWYPSDLSPRNVIVGEEGAFLVDDEPGERMPCPDGRVAPEYLPIWQRTLSTVGIDFDGDLRSLL